MNNTFDEIRIRMTAVSIVITDINTLKNALFTKQVSDSIDVAGVGVGSTIVLFSGILSFSCSNTTSPQSANDE